LIGRRCVAMLQRIETDDVLNDQLNLFRSYLITGKELVYA